MRAERDATATGTGRVDDRGEWDGLVPREEYSSQIRDQLIRPKLADKLVPPGTSERRDDAARALALLALRRRRRQQARQQRWQQAWATAAGSTAAVGDRLGNAGSCGGESGGAGSDDGEGSGSGRWLGRRRKAPRRWIQRWGGLRRRKTARATVAGSAATVETSSTAAALRGSAAPDPVVGKAAAADPTIGRAAPTDPAAARPSVVMARATAEGSAAADPTMGRVAPTEDSSGDGGRLGGDGGDKLGQQRRRGARRHQDPVVGKAAAADPTIREGCADGSGGGPTVCRRPRSSWRHRPIASRPFVGPKVNAITRRIASLHDRSSVAEMEVRAEAAVAIVVANGVFSGGERRPSHPSLIPSTKQKTGIVLFYKPNT
uniref:DUF834 domain-containing protein n=1 Tax=Oryza barthii TaxID=65489 RepID=A0A0D3EVP2_9ORYZ